MDFEVVCGDDTDYDQVLFSWIGFELSVNAEKERNLIRFLTAISETAYCKLVENETDVVFNFASVYKAVLSQMEPVDISCAKEAKGSLRILKSALTENFVLNLSAGNNAVSAVDADVLSHYADKVSVSHQLKPEVYLTASAPRLLSILIRIAKNGRKKTPRIYTCLPGFDESAWIVHRQFP